MFYRPNRHSGLLATHSATVVYLAGTKAHTQERDVERINSFAFFDLGKALKPIEVLGDNTTREEVFWAIINARGPMGQLIDGNPIPLGFSRAKAQALQSNLNNLWDGEFVGTGADGKPTIKFPDSTNTGFPVWKLYGTKRAMEEFQTVFAEELRETATYFVPRRGIFSTPALVDSADDTFPTEIIGHIPKKTRDDWKSAGRCLAFHLLSASGFHVARAVEGTMEAYYQRFSGKPGTTLVSWHEYITELENMKLLSPRPSEKTIAELRQMKNDYRNPIMHPRVVLTEPDARMLFANGESLIIAMAQELAAADQPYLAVVTSGASALALPGKAP
jgi:hypothetical protein